VFAASSVVAVAPADPSIASSAPLLDEVELALIDPELPPELPDMELGPSALA
jgi:hypothetical protein